MLFLTRLSRARKGFRLRAVESVEKRSWECFREGTKSRPLTVPLAERPYPASDAHGSPAGRREFVRVHVRLSYNYTRGVGPPGPSRHASPAKLSS